MRSRSRKGAGEAMKHPGPWKYDFGDIYDANNEHVGHFVDSGGVRSLILSAPELLDHLKMHVLARRDEGAESEGLRDSEELIARIEGGG